MESIWEGEISNDTVQHEPSIESSTSDSCESELPHSFEGCVKKLLFLIRQGNVSCDGQIADQLQDLINRAEIEAGWTGYRQGSTLFAEIAELQDKVRRFEWERAGQLLDRVLRNVQPFDIRKTLHLISKAEAAALVVEGQNIILLFAVTGAGKSTLVHFLCGSKLGMLVGENGITTIAPIEIRPELSEVLNAVRIGSEMRSETRYISAIRIDDPNRLYEDYYGPWESGEEKGVVICDAPGIQDTCGAEIDVANAAGLIRAATKAKSVRPVLLINADGGAKFESLRILIKTLARCLNNINDCIKSFSYVFTKFDDSQTNFGKSNIHARLKSILQNPSDDEMADVDFMRVIRNMAKCTHKYVCAIDPLQDSPAELLDDLMAKTPIYRPDRMFRFSVCEATLDRVTHQLQQHKSCIIDSCKRGDVDLVAHKLGELRDLNEALQLDSVDTIYNECRLHLVQHLNMQYAEAAELLDRVAKDGYPLSQTDVDFFFRRMACSQKFGALQDRHDLDKLDCISPRSFEDTLGLHIQAIKASISGLDTALIRTEYGAEKVGIETFSVRLEKLRLLCEAANMLSCYVDAQHEVANRLERCFQEMSSALNKNLYNPVAASLCEMWNAVQFQLDLHVPIHGITPRAWYDRMVMAVTKHFESFKMCEDASSGDADSSWAVGHVVLDQWRESLDMLRHAQSTISLGQHLPRDFIPNALERLEEGIAERFQVIIHTGRKLFETKQEKCFAELGSIVKNMQSIRSLPGIEARTAQLYHQFFEQVVGFLNQMKAEVEEAMSRVFERSMFDAAIAQNQTRRPNISRLPSILAGIKQAKWIEEYRDGVYVQVVESIEHAIVEHAAKMLTSARPFNVECSISVANLDWILEEFEYLSRLENSVPRLETMHAEVRSIATRSMSTAKEQASFLFCTAPDNTECGRDSAANISEPTASNCDGLNVFEAEKIQTFISTCKRMRSALIREEIAPIERSFKRGVQAHIEAIQLQITRQSDYISTFVNDFSRQNSISRNDEPAFDRSVQLLSESIVEAKMLKEKHQSLFDLYPGPEFIGNTSRCIMQIFDDLELGLEKALKDGDVVQMCSYLKDVRTLKRLDVVLDNGNARFCDLYKEYDKQLNTLMDAGFGSLKGWIEQSNFPAFLDAMQGLGYDLTSGGPKSLKVRQIQCALSGKLREIMLAVETKACRLDRNLPEEALQEIMDHWKTLKTAKGVIEFTDKSTMEAYMILTNDENAPQLSGTKFHGHVQSLRHILQMKLKFTAKQVQSAMESGLFMKADELMNRLQSAQTIIGVLVGDEISNLIAEYDHTQEKMILDKIRAFEQMEVDDYPLHPPRDFFNIFSAPGECIGSTADWPRFYQKFRTQLLTLQRNMGDKIQRKITEADLCSGSADKLTIDKILRSLPEHLQKDMERFLTEIKQVSDAELAELSKRFQASLDTFDVLSVTEVLRRKTSLTQRFENEVETRLRIFQNRIIHCLGMEVQGVNLGDANIALECLFFHGIQISVRDSVRGQICRAFCDIQRRLDLAFCVACSNIRSQLLTSSPQKQCAGSQDIVNSYGFMKQLIALNRNIAANSELVVDLLPLDLQTRFEEARRDFIAEYKQKLEQLSKVLSPEPLEGLFDIKTAAAIATQLKEREPIYLDATIQAHDGFRSRSPDTRTDSFSCEDTAVCHEFQAIVVNFVRENFMGAHDLPAELISKVHTQINREKYFAILGKRMLALPALKVLAPFLGDVNHASVGEAFKENALSQVRQMWGELQTILMEDSKISENFEKIHALYSNLKLFIIHVDSRAPSKLINLDLDEVVSKLTRRMMQLSEKVVTSAAHNLTEIVTVLLEMKKQSEGILFMRQDSEKLICESLNEFRRLNGIQGQRLIPKLAITLRRSGPVGNRIVSEMEIFHGYENCAFNSKTRSQGIEYVLKNMDDSDEVNDQSKQELSLQYGAYLKEYEALRNKFVGTLNAVSNIAALIHNQVRSMQIDDHHEAAGQHWTRDMTYAIPQLAARIFAMWTVHHSKNFLEGLDPSDRLSYLYQPHPAQVVAVFRLFGVDSTSDVSVPNRHVVQIQTGQGKTVVLAAAACIFGLFGFEVSCVCYSEYLSARDWESVRFLFEALNIEKRVTYKTLVKLCEDEINTRVNIRAKVEKTIIASSKANSLNHAFDGLARTAKSLSKQVQQYMHGSSHMPPRALLIDEVDTFFSKDFYGNLYTPSCDFRHQCISDLIKGIWMDRHDTGNLSLERVKGWDAYMTFCVQFPGWEFLLESAVSHMIYDLRDFGSHEYVCCNQKIGYKEQDGIVFNISFGYKTIFAYLQEHERGQISLDSLERNLVMLIDCGQFLFAKLPNNFEMLMGVTGTLRSLTKSEISIVRNEYNVKKFTYMPSVYGNNKLIFRTGVDVRIEQTEFFFNELAAEIDKYVRNRAVLVFFESAERLQQFFKSRAFAYRSNCNLLLEETPQIQKADIIRCRATAANSITLLTKSFARGTDFVCFDEEVNKHGGVHVLCSYMPETLSEEIQIRGRTARQGEPGSFSMILEVQDLEKFLITAEDIERHKASGTWYEMLCTKREVFFNHQHEDLKRFVVENELKHCEALSFVESLAKKDKGQVQAYLRSTNPTVKIDKQKVRILVVMDATASMSRLKSQVTNCLSIMFDRAQKILEAEVGGESLADVFEMQIAVYRNYNSSADHLLEHSSWECYPRNLSRFLDSIQTKYGWGNEAVEIGLWHANRESCADGEETAKHGKLTQVILIGDAPANTEKEVLEKRRFNGDGYWANTSFKESTHYEKEVNKLAAANIPVHTFFVDKRAESNFNQIALATKGTGHFLDLNSETLTDHITEAILASVGGSDTGVKLVDAYRARFGQKSYRATPPQSPKPTKG